MAFASLTIDINARLANLERELGKATKLAEQSAGRMSQAFGVAKTAAGALAGALSVGAVVGYVKSTIDAADAMTDLSQRIGLTVEQLAGWQHAASMSDLTTEQFADSIAKLSKVIVGAPEKLAELGVTARTSEGALLQLSDVFAGMPDGVEKTALAMELFGKAGADMIPLLNSGADGLRKMVAEGQKLNPVTEEMAKQAAEFNDNLEVLQKTAGAVGIAFTAQLLPSLTETSAAMLKLQQDGHGLLALLRGFAGVGKLPWDLIFPGQQAKNELDSVGKSLQDLRAQLAKIESIENNQSPNDYTRKQRALLEGRIKAMEDYARRLNSIDVFGDKKFKTADNGTADFIREQQAAIDLLNAQPAASKKAESSPVRRGTSVVSSGRSALTEAMEEGKRLYESTRQPMEQLAAEQAKLQKLLDAGAISWDTYSRAMFDAQDKMAGTTAAAEELDPAIAGLIADTPIMKAQALEAALYKLDQAMLDGKISADVHQQAIESAVGGYDKLKEQGKSDLAELQQAVEGWGKASADAIVQFAFTGKTSFSGMIDSMLQDLAKMVVYKSITQPLFNAIGGAFGIKANADGGVYSSPSLAAYSNQVVSSPTLFAFAKGGAIGLMGEAGSEAIMPLQRDASGRLGVRAELAGGGSVINQVSITVNNDGAHTERGDGGVELARRLESAVRGVLVQEKRPGGLLAA